MPIYVYECSNSRCPNTGEFEVFQRMKDKPLKSCPECKKAVRKVIVPVAICSPTGNTDLRDMGFTKLVRRDQGVYENVTATGDESRYWDAEKPGTAPHLKKKVSD